MAEDEAGPEAASLVSDPVCGEVTAMPKRKLTADVVTQALLNLAARTPLADPSLQLPPAKRYAALSLHALVSET
jgi:hypothetical protein